MIAYREITAKVWYLQMDEKPAAGLYSKSDCELKLLPKPVDCETYRRYYYGVGKDWNWIDRMVMKDETLFGKINSGDTHIYIFKRAGEDAGFVELVHSGGVTDIQYFGLFPEFIGKGLGKYFLMQSILLAWSFSGTECIQLNTCSLDHDNALSVYLSAGFKIVRTAGEIRKLKVDD